MKFKSHFILILIYICIISSPLIARSEKTKTVYISVESIAAKESPSFWSSESDTFYYGDPVKIIEEKKSWYNIKSLETGKSGWVKDTVVTTKKINPGRKVSVDAREIALAGKGFASPIEEEYSSIYKLNYDKVDKIEKTEISDTELKAFIEEGELSGGDNER